MAKDIDLEILKDFDKITKEKWIELALQDFKDKSRAFWNTGEGFDVAPFYTKEDIISGLKPGLKDSIKNDWTYLEHINTNDLTAANKKALSALNMGAEGLIFQNDQHIVPDLDVLLKNIYPEHCTIYFNYRDFISNVLNDYFNILNQNNHQRDSITGGLLYNPIIDWTLRSPQLPLELGGLVEVFTLAQPFRNFKCLSLSSEVFKNSGATLVQEASLLISQLIAYVQELSAVGVDPELIFERSFFNIAVGGNYFFEIAKLRALRTLIIQVAKAYKVKNFSTDTLHIHVETSWWTKTVRDPFTNILRNTTEAMAGILGGCSSLSILPHDVALNEQNEFSSRVSRNISNLLRDEAYFNKVSNPVAGSYYIESLTEMMTGKIWDNVQKIEQQGGFIKAFESGFIKNMVEPNYRKAIDSVVNVEKKIIGTNYHENQDDINKLFNNLQPKKGWFAWDRISEKSEQGK